jgi:signal transduction histidine kinase
LALVGLLPAALLGWLSFSVNRAELERTVGSAQAAVAEEAARSCERFVAQALESLRLSASVLPLPELSESELATVLRIPYRQLEFVDALWVLSPAGKPLGAAVWESGNGKPAPDTAALLRAAPAALAAQTGMAIGAPYAAADGSMRLPVALRLDAERVLAAELSLSPLQRQLRQTSRNGSIAYLATQSGTVLAQPSPVSPGSDERELLRTGGVRLVQRSDGAQWLAAAARVGALGWTVMVAQPARDALRPAAVVRGYTLFWLLVALVLVGVLGALLSRRVTDPIRKLEAGVKALLEGRAQRAEIDSGDEIGQFARAFNEMAGELVRRGEEIRLWNVELQQRVDQRTAELKAAQDQILRARRLAALGSLGAGMAHELNNPLTAISGLASLLRKELEGTPHESSLRTLQEQAKRMSKIVSDLRVFADQERSQGGRRFPLRGSVLAALDLYGEQLRANGIRLTTDLRPGMREAQGDPAQIQQAVAHLVANAIQAMPDGGELKVSLSDVDGDALKLTVSDTGKGIPASLRERIFDPFFTTKDQPCGVGLGLSISHTIVEAHHGKLSVESAEGHGATFSIVLPAAPLGAHLR